MHQRQAVDGPTQTAVPGAADEWAPRPVAALLTGATVFVFPYLVGFGVALALSQRFPANDLDLHPLLWWLGLVVISTASMIPAERFIRRFIPLRGLLRVTLTFPDAAPSRFRSAMRSSSTAKVRRRVQAAVDNAERGEAVDRSQYMLDLVSMLTAHDRLTRGHSERVRAYASLIGEELRLPKADQQKLYWAALLHDVGKLDVPAGLLNKKGRPTKREWEIIQTHPDASGKYLAPLGGWLGHWAGAASEHHLRWDGRGYPNTIGGTDISHGGRIVAVADAFDTMTSTRSYKQPMSAADARVELSKCAGSQFDPTVVRAFLNVGLRRVRLAVGPFASLPVVANSLVNGVATGAGKIALGATALTTGVAASPPAEPPVVPALLAFADDAAGWVDAEIAALRSRDAELDVEAEPPATPSTVVPVPVPSSPTPAPQTGSSPPPRPTLAAPPDPTPGAPTAEPTPTPIPPGFDLFDDPPADTTTTDTAPTDDPDDENRSGGNHGLGNQGNGGGNQGQGNGPGGRSGG